MIKISVIIPTYNEESYLEGVLSDLSKQTLPRRDFEIIVVDGHSKDKTVEIAKKYADKVVMQKSKGIGGARDEGVNVSRGRVVISTDADVRLENDFLERCLGAFEKNGKFVAFTGPFTSIERDFKSRFVMGFLSGLNYLASFAGIPILPGFYTVIRKDTLDAIGGYKHFDLLEDGELTLNLVKKRYKVGFNKNVKVRVSARRFKKEGYIKLVLIWATEFLRLLFKGEPKKREYSRVYSEKRL